LTVGDLLVGTGTDPDVRCNSRSSHLVEKERRKPGQQLLAPKASIQGQFCFWPSASTSPDSVLNPLLCPPHLSISPVFTASSSNFLTIALSCPLPPPPQAAKTLIPTPVSYPSGKSERSGEAGGKNTQRQGKSLKRREGLKEKKAHIVDGLVAVANSLHDGRPRTLEVRSIAMHLKG
jgi:hypothetical protein